MSAALAMIGLDSVCLTDHLSQSGIKSKQEAQLPQRNSASAVHVSLGWLTDMQCTEHRRIAEVVLFLTFKRSDSSSAGRKRILS